MSATPRELKRALVQREKAVWTAHAGMLAWPTLALAGGVWAATLASWSLALAGVLPLWLAGILQVPLSYAAFTPMHDATHGAISGGRKGLSWLDDAVGWACALLMLAPYPAFKAIHLAHHSHTNHPEKDPDRWVASASWLGVAARCLTITPRHYATYLFQIPVRTKRQRRQKLAAVAVLIGLVGVWAGAALVGLGPEVLALWLLPSWVASVALAFLFDWWPHQPHDTQGRYIDTRGVIDERGWFRLLMLGQEAHLAHHLYPRVPFYRYAVVLRELETHLVEERGADVVRWPRR